MVREKCAVPLHTYVDYVCNSTVTLNHMQTFKAYTLLQQQQHVHVSFVCVCDFKRAIRALKHDVAYVMSVS